MVSSDTNLDQSVQAKNMAKAEFLRGLVVVVIGFIATFVSYKMVSAKGGTYIVAGGAFIVGGYQLFHGLYLLLNPRAALKQFQSGKTADPAKSALKVFGILFALIIIAGIIVSVTRKDNNSQNSVSKQNRTKCNAEYADLTNQAQANSRQLIATTRSDPQYAVLSDKQQSLDKQVLDKYNQCQKP